jgi:hypothetical protein
MIAAACGGASSPPPIANAASSTMAASTTCFQEPAVSDSRPIRWVELDPAKHTMHLRRTDAGELDRDLALIVDGDTVSNPAAHVTGTLLGEPWKWTSWTLTIDGKQTTTTITPTGMRVGDAVFLQRPCPDKSRIDI